MVEHVHVTHLTPELGLALRLATYSLQLAGLQGDLREVHIHVDPEASVCEMFASFSFQTPLGEPLHVDVEMDTCEKDTGSAHNFRRKIISFTQGIARTDRYRSWEIIINEDEAIKEV